MSVPLISTSFVQMAYNMTDMLWLGHLGSESVAAVGAAGFFTWLCNSISLFTKTGAEITIAQSIGAKEQEKAGIFANQSIILSSATAFLVILLLFICAPLLLGFFSFESSITEKGIDYLRFVAPGMFFQFNNNTYSGI